MATAINPVLGKGRVYFEQFAAGTTQGAGELYLMQTTEFNYNSASETLDYYDADEGLNVLVEQVTTKVDLTGKMVSRHISLEHVGLFLLSDGVQSTTVTSATAVTNAFTGVKRGRYLQLGKSAGTPQGVRGATVTGIALTSTPGTPITGTGNWVQTADDIALGRVYIEDASVGIADNANITVTYNVAAGSRSTVISKDQQIRGALRFVSDNPRGDQKDFYFPMVNISPDGDFNLKGDDWQEISWSFTALKRDSATERLYVDGRAA